MKTYFVRAALACAALAIMTTAAMAAVEPIPGVDVVPYCHNHPCHLMVQQQTDGSGQVSFKLAPGDYELVIDGPSLVAAMDKLAPPEKKSGGGFSLGIGGGMFGGGSSHSSSGHEGAGPIGGGHDTHSSSHSSGGGIGLGLSIPIGGKDEGDKNCDQPGAGPPGIIPLVWAGNGNTVPYCRGSAGQGTRFGFTVPEGDPQILSVGISANVKPGATSVEYSFNSTPDVKPEQAHFNEVMNKITPTPEFQSALKAKDAKRVETLLREAGAGDVNVKSITIKDGKGIVTYSATWIELAVVIAIIA